MAEEGSPCGSMTDSDSSDGINTLEVTCGENLYCKFDGVTAPTCQKPVEIGHTCVMGVTPCADRGVCYGGACRALDVGHTVGAPCVAEATGASGAICNELLGLECVDGVCAASFSDSHVGARCATRTAIASGLNCPADTFCDTAADACTELRADGELCTSLLQCASHTCRGGLCAANCGG
jgi:hypothetical protein